MSEWGVIVSAVVVGAALGSTVGELLTVVLRLLERRFGA